MALFMSTTHILRRTSVTILNFSKNENAFKFHKFARQFNTTPIIYKFPKSLKKSFLTPKNKKYLKYLIVGSGIGLFLAGGQLFDNFRNKGSTFLNLTSGEEYFLNEPPPEQKIARSIQNSGDRSGLKITLYQFQTCPFCCKVRAFLDYYGFSYNVVEVNSVTHTQTKWSSYRKVPFIVIEQQGSEKVMQLKDSSMIISALQSFLVNKSQTLDEMVKGFMTVTYTDDSGAKKTDIMNRYFIFYGQHPPGKTKEQVVHERKWRKWVDDVYVHVLSPNVYRTMSESFQAFDWFSKAGNWEEIFATWERLLVIYVGSIAMYFIGKILKKRHHIKDEVRLSFYEETNVWLKEIKGTGGKFLGGDEPNLADLGVYGVLTAVEGCDAFQELLVNTKVKSWFNSMREAVNNHQGAKYLTERGGNKA